MKILHVIRDLLSTSGGPVTAVHGIADAQSSLGHDVTIAATYSDYNYKPDKKYDIYTFTSQYKSWCLSAGLAKALPSLILDADIVYLHTVWEFPVLAAAKFAKKFGKPYIVRPCGMLDKWSLSQSALKKKIYLKLVLDSVLKNAAAIYFTSEGEKHNSWRGSSISRCFVLPIGVSVSAYENLPEQNAFYQRYPILEGKRIVLFLGRLHFKKQPDVVIRALQKVYENNSNIHLVMVGPGEKDYVEKLKQLAIELKVEKNITFTGMLVGTAVREAYRAAELSVLPSLQENFGIAIAESMAAGCPVVVSNRVNLAPAISESEAGIVCPPEVEPMAGAMMRILGDRKLHNRMSDNGRNLVLENYVWDKIAKELIVIQNDLLSGKQLSSAWG